MTTTTHTCESLEPLLADVVLGDAPPAVRAQVAAHCDCCAACADVLHDATSASALLSVPLAARPSAHVREALVAQVRSDLAAPKTVHVVAAILAGAVAAVAGLVLADTRAPLASGFPLLVCGAAWTAAIGLGIYLAIQRRASTRWPIAALAGVGAVLLMSVVCPPPALVATGREAGWLAVHGIGAELLVGVGFGVVPMLIALVVARDARTLTNTTLAVGGLLLAAEMPLLFAQCCDEPAVSAWPVLGGTAGGAALVMMAVVLLARLHGEHSRSSHV